MLIVPFTQYPRKAYEPFVVLLGECPQVESASVRKTGTSQTTGSKRKSTDQMSDEDKVTAPDSPSSSDKSDDIKIQGTFYLKKSALMKAVKDSSA
mmetsp:Transcript_27875/g.45258  ORF Transcript_27875/g.45258 Transcript_27875/m.45258 type:complete len:95 (+) Transcript_27875:787-1071(+)